MNLGPSLHDKYSCPIYLQLRMISCPTTMFRRGLFRLRGRTGEGSGRSEALPTCCHRVILVFCCIRCCYCCCLPHWHHPRPLWMRSQIVRERMRRRTEGGAGCSEVRGTPRRPPGDIFHGSTALLKTRFDNCYSSNSLRYLKTFSNFEFVIKCVILTSTMQVSRFLSKNCYQYGFLLKTYILN